MMRLRSLTYALALSCSLSAAAAPPVRPSGIVAVRGSQNKALDCNASTVNLTNHGGPVILNPKVVLIFWGPNFGNAASPDFAYAQTLRSFRDQLGATPEFNVITQYSGIQLAFLGAGTPDWFDSSTPPANVTDAIARSKVNQYLTLYPANASAIYEIVLPSSSFSSMVFNGVTQTSCGGSNLQFCAYHGFIGSGASAVKYSVQAYPSCAGCQFIGTAVQSQEKFVTHETREATTDPLLNAWFDSNGCEADDKCNNLVFFGTGGYAYQQEWSNAAHACVASVPVSGPPPPGNPFVFASAADERQSCTGIASRTTSPCDSVGDFNDRQMCYALAQSSQTPCQSITDRNLQLSCYGMAFKPNFPSNCNDITDLDMKQFCFGASGVSMTDLNKCTPISARNTQLLCYAMNDFITSNCDSISNNNDRQFCRGVSGHNSAACATIQ